MDQSRMKIWTQLSLALAAGGLFVSMVAGGCVAIADIDGIEIGTTGAGATTDGGSGGNGGSSGGSGGSAASGGSGGAEPTCQDDVKNGQETGIDCGGPDCPACVEDCTNGIDDDGNDLIDCADPLCPNYTCAPAPPPQWSGPVAFFVGTQGEALPECHAAWPTAVPGGSGTLDAPAAQCGACGCDPPAGATCDAPELQVWDVAACQGTVLTTFTIPVIGSCHSFGGTSNTSSIASTVPVSGGACPPTGGTATVDPATWSAPALVCDGATLGAGCATAQQVCLRQPDAPFGTSLCVTQAGDIDCPIEHYTDKTVIYGSLADDRDCSACTCDGPTGITCQGLTNVYSNQSCTLGEVTVPNDGASCTEAPGLKSVRFTVSSGPDGGSCDPSGGQPTGAATPGDGTTVCCIP